MPNIRCSTVSPPARWCAVMSLVTTTSRVWPSRWHRSMACARNVLQES